jgi:hypothetical protein
MDVVDDDDVYFDTIEDTQPSTSAYVRGEALSPQMEESFVQLDKTSSSEGVTKSDSEPIDDDHDFIPQGRKQILNDDAMLCNENEPLWIPETQVSLQLTFPTLISSSCSNTLHV